MYKKKYDITKNLWQCFLAFVELGGVCTVFILLTNKYVPCNNIIDYVERGTLGVAIYEFVIFVTLNFINDAKRDEYNVINSLYLLAILAVEENSSEIKNFVHYNVEKQKDHGMMNSLEIRKEYEILLNALDSNDKVDLKMRQILVEECMNAQELAWKYTLLLRWFK